MRSMTPLGLEDFASAPFRLTATTLLDADPLAVFAELGDPSMWWPLMRRSIWRTGATSGVGAEREVDVRLFGKFRERMIAWEPGARVAFTMTASTSPLVARMAEDWRLSREDIGTRLDWTVAAVPSALGRPVTPALRGIMRALFARGCTTLGKRAGSVPRRGKQVS